MMTLADPIEHARACFGGRIAVIDGERTITYIELADRCRRLAASLAALGVQRSDRVALLSANGHRYLEAFFGLPAAGMVLVPLNTRLAPVELAHIVQHSGARVLITDRDAGSLGDVVEHVIEIEEGYERLLGYWDNAAATADALRDGWYHTGDLGYLNDRNYLFVVDRAKDMIVSGGENVYSVEVEDVLYRHAAVAEAAVFGVPDDRWGEAVHAIVVPHPGMTVSVDELRDHCRALIAGYKVPKAIDISIEPLPKSGPGKILKRILRDRYLIE